MITIVADTSQVAEARRQVSTFARGIGLSENRTAQAALTATELATNLLTHGGGGEILAARFEDEDGMGLELLALDRGAGMADVERCMRDGYSTAGTPGGGLGAITRQADQMRIYSRPGAGTAIMARFTISPPGPGPKTQCGVAAAPFPGERISGDSWCLAYAQAGRTLLMVDGAGHGPEAARAANCAVAAFHANVEEDCEHLIESMHRALAATRGAALAVARIDASARLVRYAGIGNISGLLVSDGVAKHMVSHNGTAGHVAARIREFTYPFSADPLVILHSDGLTSRWDLAAYPGLIAQHPSLIAGVLLRDFRRGRDDATVVAIRAVL
ncbi:MAG TPA: ATP-binding SpoIIE family protein phosphatase [Acetobacteraceae bacterium]|nr:ATP-binding SpoIIE family protein phosphatase [Acetobacteraceae bacterium]